MRCRCRCRLPFSSSLAVATAAVALTASPAPAATAIAARASTYGGTTAQGFPVVVDLSATGRQVVRAVAGIRMTCTSGGVFTLPDSYVRVSVSKTGRFRAAFGPLTDRNSDGTTTDFQGSMTGAFNAARSKVSGKWSLTATLHDATGAMTDTCTMSTSWTAKQ